MTAAAPPRARRRPAPDDRDRSETADRHADEVAVRPVRRRAPCSLVLPLLRFGHEQPDEKHQQGRQRAADHQEAPSGVREQALDHRRRHPDAEQQRFDAADEPVQADAEEADHEKSEVRRGADEAGDQRARFVRPDFVDQRDAERPFAAHAERRDEPQRGDVPRLGRKPAEAGKQRVGEDAQRHRAHAADAVAEPAEEHAAGRGADEEHGNDGAEPLRSPVRPMRVRADRSAQGRRSAGTAPSRSRRTSIPAARPSVPSTCRSSIRARPAWRSVGAVSSKVVPSMWSIGGASIE